MGTRVGIFVARTIRRLPSEREDSNLVVAMRGTGVTNFGQHQVWPTNFGKPSLASTILLFSRSGLGPVWVGVVRVGAPKGGAPNGGAPKEAVWRRAVWRRAVIPTLAKHRNWLKTLKH